ncbi:MAG: nucleolar RNA-binding Nop10p family protein [archaeon]|nr:ribosome biogenesis protein [Euryarchaeota archaeon]MDP6704586.1 nucleolar RNA-binding Nop10p family protein [archaeon]HIK01271.1 ribosome biogenesis protein [Candidatus Undinarchaeales archaeon ERR594346 U_76725]
MMAKILRCTKCRQYTIKTICPNCKIITASPEPAKYDPKDKYGKYRRQARTDGNLRKV